VRTPEIRGCGVLCGEQGGRALKGRSAGFIGETGHQTPLGIGGEAVRILGVDEAESALAIREPGGEVSGLRLRDTADGERFHLIAEKIIGRELMRAFRVIMEIRGEVGGRDLMGAGHETESERDEIHAQAIFPGLVKDHGSILGESERRRGILRREEQTDNRAEAILMDDETSGLLRDLDVVDGRGADIDAIERDRSARGIRGDGPGSALERDDAETVHMAAVHGFVGRIDFRDKGLFIAEESLLLASVLQPESVRDGLLLRERDGRRREILMGRHRDRSGRGGIREPGGQVLLKDRSDGQMVTAVGLIDCVMDILPRRANARRIERHHGGLKHQGFALLHLA
jgi:hypothetical protein